MSSAVALPLAALLLALNAFFVAGEFALTSSRRSQVLPLVEAGKRGARDALWALENVSSLLAALQVGVTFASTALGAIAEPAFARLFASWLSAWPALASLAHPLAFATALLLVVTAHIVLGEMVPKNLAVALSHRLLLVLAPVLRPFSTVLSPVVNVFNRGANACLRRLGIEPQEHVVQAFTASQVATLVEESVSAGTLEAEAELLSSAMEIVGEQVGDVLVPRPQIVTLNWPVTCAEVERAAAETGFSRFPVKGQNEAWTGYIHLKDALSHEAAEMRELPLPAWKLRELQSVSPSTCVSSALKRMQQQGLHLLSVQDETGAVLGAVFLEDLLEQIVGEVNDALAGE